MSKNYIFRVLGRDKYLVSRIDDKLPRGKRFKEYLVDLRNGDMLCDCPGFFFYKRACKHILFILEQLKDGGGILDFQQEGDYDKLMEGFK